MRMDGLIFDMDGTLTVPVIDFAEIRAALGCEGHDIAAWIQALPEPHRHAAWSVVEGFEEAAVAGMELRTGCRALLQRCHAAQLPMALVTRNRPPAVAALLARVGPLFDPVLTRDFKPIKPDPAPVHHILAQWGIRAERTLFVGDYRHDIECGRAAGTRTCFVSYPGKEDFSEMADFAVDSLSELERRLFAPSRGCAQIRP
jgi:HAD superfamily hydrolase (TIGR01549 family)